MKITSQIEAMAECVRLCRTGSNDLSMVLRRPDVKLPGEVRRYLQNLVDELRAAGIKGTAAVTGRDEAQVAEELDALNNMGR